MKRPTAALVGTVLVFTVAAGVGVLRTILASAGERRVEGPLPTVALVLIVATPDVLALIGTATIRPMMVFGAATVCFPLGFVSPGIAPLWIPGVVLFASGVRMTRDRASAPGTLLSAMTSLLSIAVADVGTLVAFAILETDKATYQVTYAHGSEGGSYERPSSALVSMVVIAATSAIATIAAGGRFKPSAVSE